MIVNKVFVVFCNLYYNYIYIYIINLKTYIMKTLLKNEFCEIKRTIENRLLRVDLILDTEMYIPYYINKNEKLIK